MISIRIMATVIGLVMAYAAVYFGEGLHLWWVSIPDGLENAPKNWVWFVLFVISVASFAGGSVFWGIFMKTLLVDLKGTRSYNSALFATLPLLGSAFAFGIVVGPFTTWGPWPLAWASTWDILLVVGVIPLAFVIHGIIADVMEKQRAEAPVAARPSDESPTVTQLRPKDGTGR